MTGAYYLIPSKYMVPLNEASRIVDQLKRGYDADCWHGPALRALLQGIDARTAARTFPPLAHSIWGIVNHLAAWIEVVALRIIERREMLTPAAGDFPPVAETSEAAWTATLFELDKQHRALLKLVPTLDAKRLDEIVVGKPYSAAVMLYGTAEHYAYHAGQIALLKKLAST